MGTSAGSLLPYLQARVFVRGHQPPVALTTDHFLHMYKRGQNGVVTITGEGMQVAIESLFQSPLSSAPKTLLGTSVLHSQPLEQST